MMVGAWRQYHGDGPNKGFSYVLTQPAITPKWQIEVGPVGYGSPVISPKGAIYIGTLKGELIAISPKGSIIWRHQILQDSFSPFILGSPAIDKDGNIYVIGTFYAPINKQGFQGVDFKVYSILYSFDETGKERWSYHFPSLESDSASIGYTLSSPKIFGEQEAYIFIPVRFSSAHSKLEIVVLGNEGKLVHRQEISPYSLENDGCQVSIKEYFHSLLTYIKNWESLHEVGPESEKSLEEIFGLPEPTMAIVDFYPHELRPIIIIDDNYCGLFAYHWQDNQLTKLWSHIDNYQRMRSSCAVFTNGLIAVGQQDGMMALYSIIDGQELGQPWFKAPHPIYAPPVSFGHQIFFASRQSLFLIEPRSKLLESYNKIGDSLAAPALSSRYIFVCSTEGLWTFNFALEKIAVNREFKGGVSSPALDYKGFLYAIDLKGVLWAFGESRTARKTSKKSSTLS